MSLPQSYDDVPMEWVGDWSGRRALITPHREALYDSLTGERYTYQQLDERAKRIGTYLVDELNLQKGDVICFIARNRVEPIDLYFACGKTGVVLSPLSYRLAKRELDDLLNRIQPKVLFYEDHFGELVSSLNLPASIQTKIEIGDEHSAYERVLNTTEPRNVNRALAMSELYLYVHTGGTTATPKICLVTHRQMIWNSFDLLATGSGGAGMGGRELVTFPLFHIGGWNTVTPIFHIGGYVVLMREFDPTLALELIDSEKITHFGGVEAMFKFMIASPKFAETQFEHVQYINSAGAPCSAEVMRFFWEKGVPLTQSYGLTEAGPSNYIYLPDGQPMSEIEAHADSIGFPMFHGDAKIVDLETGQPVQPGEVGELCFKSPHCFDGYLNDLERTASVVDSDGWVHSRDLAKHDENGFTIIVGRADNMYVSGGENVSPEEIEQVLADHPAIAAVSVVDVPDEQWGQVALAVLVKAPSAEIDERTLETYCREHLAGFKVPKHWRFVDALPLTGAGKIDRTALRGFL